MPRTSTTFDVTCPQCKRAIVVNESQVGALFTCTDCLEEFVVVRPPQSKPVARDIPNKKTTDTANRNSEPDDSVDDIWDDDRKQIDALLNVPSVPSPDEPSGAEPYDFTTACPLCGTRLDVRSEQIGHSVRCPDCHSQYQVREPSRKGRRTPHSTTASNDDELRLSDPPLTPPKKLQLEDFLDQQPSPSPPRPPAGEPTRILTPEVAARDRLAQAEEELAEKERDEPPLPPSPMVTGLFRFLQHPVLILRIFFIAIGLWLELGMIQTALFLTGGGALQQFGSVILRPLAVVCGVLFAANFATTLLAILEDTAYGKDEIVSLPGANPVEWFFDSWQLFASLFLTFALAGIVTQSVYSTTGSWSTAFWFGFVPAGVLLATVFPVILLSFLENNTPFSSAIWRGLRLSAKHWLIFTLEALVVAAIGLGLCVARIKSSSGFLNLLYCAGLIVTSMLFFRLLGRLTWVCQEKLGELKARQAAEKNAV